MRRPLAGKVEEVYLLSKLMCKLYAASRRDTLTNISRRLGVSVQELSRIMRNKEPVSARRAADLVSRLAHVDEDAELRRSIREAPLPFPHLNNLTSRYPLSLYCFLYKAIDAVKDLEFGYIVTVEGAGLVLATLMAVALGKRLVYGIKAAKVAGGRSFTAGQGPAYSLDATRRTVSFPSALDLKGERAVVVDGVVWTGATVKSMSRYVVKKGGVVEAGVLMVTTREVVEMLERELECPVHALLTL
ncbi:phosphoribosyltransferase family protein [Thermogladius sp. KZ2Tp1]|uniref:phosphoribosyltransferase family protein n=1 Tax=Thermogladius sp. KZ2Tp1 TaxID=3136289 RepID=UPI003DA980D6